jgi:hypothetical protein
VGIREWFLLKIVRVGLLTLPFLTLHRASPVGSWTGFIPNRTKQQVPLGSGFISPEPLTDLEVISQRNNIGPGHFYRFRYGGGVIPPVADQ